MYLITTLKYLKQKNSKLKGETDKPQLQLKILTCFSSKWYKDTKDLKNTINQFDQINI